MKRGRAGIDRAAPVWAMTMAVGLLLLAVARPGTTLLSLSRDAAFLSALTVMPEGGVAYLEGRVMADPALPLPMEETGEAATPTGDAGDVGDVGEATASDAAEPETESEPDHAPVDTPTTPSLSDYEEPVVLPVPQNRRGTILRQQYSGGSSGAGYVKLRSGYLRNVTALSDDAVAALLKAESGITLADTEEPQVLLYHTHATESYEPVTRDYFDKEDASGRTTDNDHNVTRVGDVIAAQLEALGIGVVHDKTQHDYPSYNGSYDRSRETIESYLERYPSIKIILDIHRDALETEDGTRMAPVAEIDGRNAAQVMIIAGCDDGTLDNPYWEENLRFAADLQANLESMFPGLTRPILFDYRRYNQHLMPGALLIEVGGHANSMSEALYAGECIGKALAATLRGYISSDEEVLPR